MKVILIVDDVEAYIRALQRALSDQYIVLSAMSFTTARQMLQNRTPDLILLDIRLSERDSSNRDGIALLRWFRQRNGVTPVVMMSAYQDYDASVDALNLGADRYIEKPIALRKLKEILQELTENGTPSCEEP